MDWLRWYHGTATDAKWKVISKITRVHFTAVGMIWATMLESASQSEVRGQLSGWEPEEIAASLDLETEQVQAVYEAMQGRTLDGKTLTSWDKRNPKRERDDNSAERVQRHRESVKRHVTPRNAKKRLEERRVEEKKEGEGETRIAFGEFGHALLTQEQHGKLKKKLSVHLDDFISQFDTWVHQAPDAKHNGVRRRDRDPYASIGSWFDRAVKEGKVKVRPAAAKDINPHTYL